MVSISNAQSIGKRKKQEDYFASRSFKDGYICVVADGIGGESGGELASKMCVKAFLNHLKTNQTMEDFKTLFLNALFCANEAIKHHVAHEPRFKNMGTTFCALFISEKRAFWVSVGDSIIYLLRNGVLKRLNEEHLEVGEINQKLLKGEISQKEFDFYPNKHIITSALSGEEIELIDISSRFFKVKDGDLFMVASDGLHTLAKDDLTVTCELEGDCDLAEKIVQKIKMRDKKNQDNVTLITIKTTQQEVEKEKFLSINGIKSKILARFNHDNP